MRKKTKNQRLIEVVEAFQAKVGGRPFTVQEVTDWAIERGLYPVPTTYSPADECAAWDEKLSQINEQAHA